MTSTPAWWLWEDDLLECERDIEWDDEGLSISPEALTGTAAVKGTRYEMNALVAWRTFCPSQFPSHKSGSYIFHGNLWRGWSLFHHDRLRRLPSNSTMPATR
jgi:hypothetical protein